MSQEEYKDYKLEYCKETVNDRLFLFVILHTDEYGDIKSNREKATGNHSLDMRVMDSIADDLIDEYEDRLKFKP